MICRRCGKSFNDSYKSCPFCGAPTGAPMPGQQRPPVNPQQSRRPLQPNVPNQSQPPRPRPGANAQQSRRPLQPNVPNQPRQQGYQPNPQARQPYPQRQPMQPQQRPQTPQQYPQRGAYNNPPRPAYQGGAATARPGSNTWKILVPIIAVLLVFALLAGIFAVMLGSSSSVYATDYQTPMTGNAGYVDNSPTVNDTEKSQNYTLMIYMVGSNLESESQFATSDLYEIIGADVDPSMVNVIIYAGGSNSWSVNISSSQRNILKLYINQDGQPDLCCVVQDDNVENMGDPNTLTGFMDFCVNNYPADHYGLICWDHGGGPAEGFGQDEIYNDILSSEETQTALSNSKFNSSNKLDFIGYDACLMGTMEIASIWADYADYMIASEETEPGEGWNYNFLEAFSRTTDSSEICKTVLNDYAQSIENTADSFGAPNYTLSAMDLSKTQNLVTTMTSLLNVMNVQFEAGDYSTIAYNGIDIREFGLDSGYSWSLYDINDFVDKLSVKYPAECASVKTAVSNMVIGNSTNMTGAGGISFFYPAGYNVRSFPVNIDDEYTKAITGVNNSLAKRATQSNTDWTLSEVKLDSDNAVISLTDDQRADMSEAYYTVFRAYDDDKLGTLCAPVMSECKIAPDENNNLNVTLDPEILLASSVSANETENIVPYSVRQTSCGDGYETYQSVNSRLWNAFEYLPYGDFESVNIDFNRDSDGLTVTSVLSYYDDLNFNGKLTIDAEDWGYMGYNSYTSYYDDTKPYSEWTEDGTVYFSAVHIDENINFDMVNTSELTESFLCQIIVKDSAGNEYPSAVFSLKNAYDSGVKQEIVNTNGGTMSFDVYSDHAEFALYEGTDTELVIPENVDGVEVTTVLPYAFGGQPGQNHTITSITVPDTVTNLMMGAFSYCTELKDINIPEGVTEIPYDCFLGCEKLESVDLHSDITIIGSFAFAKTGLTSIDLPKKVENIGIGVFATTKLTEIKINGGSSGTNYKVKDGMLLTKNGKELLAGVVPADATSLKIPDGVEYIRDYALCENFNENLGSLTNDPVVEELILPDSLVIIGDFAFVGCVNLKSLTLPEKLESIGDSAFMSYLYQHNNTIELSFGKYFKYLGCDAFYGYDISYVTVDSENTYFASNNGTLTTKGGEPITIGYYDIS